MYESWNENYNPHTCITSRSPYKVPSVSFRLSPREDASNQHRGLIPMPCPGLETALTSAWMVKMQCDLEEFCFRECSAMVWFVSPYRKEGVKGWGRNELPCSPSFLKAGKNSRRAEPGNKATGRYRTWMHKDPVAISSIPVNCSQRIHGLNIHRFI